jgi:adenosylcobinamide-GDP ribazoletransferase
MGKIGASSLVFFNQRCNILYLHSYSSWLGVGVSGHCRWAPIIGLLIGGILGILDAGLQQLGVPVLTRSALVVASWIALTGGLHLDGVMDTADGLAVQDRQRRLEVMADSATGAFGAIAAVALLLLKTAALTDIETYRGVALMASAGWGRWGQVVAIALYPYLNPQVREHFTKKRFAYPKISCWDCYCY